MIAGVPTPLIEKSEAASMLGISERTLWRLVSEGTVRSLKLGRRRMILLASVEELIAWQGKARHGVRS